MASLLDLLGKSSSSLGGGGSFLLERRFCPAFRKGKKNELTFMECLLGGRINFRDLQTLSYLT